MPTLSTAALAECSKLSPELHPVLEITGLSTARRYAREGYPIGSVSLGSFTGRITAWGGPLWYRLPRAQWTLESIRYAVTLRDFDRDITKVTEGGQWRNWQNAVVRIRLASPNIPEAEWPVWFVGRIQAKPEGAGPLTWRLKLSTLDDAFRSGKVPPASFNPWWFPNANTGDFYGKPIPLAWGIIDSTDGTLKGAVGSMPAYYIGQVGSEYWCVALYGEAFHVERVFKDDAVQTSSAWSKRVIQVPGNYKVPSTGTYPIMGTRITVIALLADPGTSKITWDGVGYARVSAYLTNAVPITNAALAMRHCLNNFVLPTEAWRNGDWLDWNGSSWVDHARLDQASWDAAVSYCDARALRGARWIGGDSPQDFTDGLVLLNEWSQSHGMQPFWTPEGKLAVKPWNPCRAVDLGAMTWFQPFEPEQNPIVPDDTTGDAEIASEVAVDGWDVPSAGSKRMQLAAADASLPRLVRPVSRPWAVARQRFPYENLHSPSAVYLAHVLKDETNTVTPYDGQDIKWWFDMKALGTPYSLSQATDANKPHLKLGATRGCTPSVTFDGANHYMSGTTFSNLTDGVNLTVHFAVKLTANGGSNNDGNAHQNPTVWCDNGGYIGVHVRNNGGQNQLQFSVWNGVTRYTIALNVSLDTWYICSMSLDNASVLRASVKLFAVTALSASGMGATSGVLTVGRNYNGSAYFTGELAALIFQTAFQSGGWNHLIYESLADLLRLPEGEWAY